MFLNLGYEYEWEDNAFLPSKAEEPRSLGCACFPHYSVPPAQDEYRLALSRPRDSNLRKKYLHV